MRPLHSRPTPQALARLEALNARRREAEAGGPALSDAESAGYRHPDVKDAIVIETAQKCAYCESYITHVYWGDVEHIWPKHDQCRPELRFDYENLTLACSKCNNNKRDYCDHIVPLVNPYRDEVDDHFLWLGPLTWATAHSDRGEITVSRLKLNRWELVQRRQERIEAVGRLARRYLAQPEGPLKDALLEQIQEETFEEREYTAHVLEAVRALGVSV